jgi:type II secretion system protein J
MTRILPPVYRAGSGGFTLLEVLIAIALLALMGIAISQVTVRAFHTNFELGNESTDYVGLVLSLQSVEADLSQIYSPALDPTQTAMPKDSQGKEPGLFWTQALRSDGIRRSRFTGDKEKISFVNNGNLRVEADSPQSDFQKVTWEIERNDSGAYSLYRSTDWNAFEYDDSKVRKPVRVALLENLSSARFSYYRKENTTWEDQWDSEGRFVKPESRFPDLISLKITAPDPLNSANQLQWEVIVKPEMALNPAAATPQQATGAQP